MKSLSALLFTFVLLLVAWSYVPEKRVVADPAGCISFVVECIKGCEDKTEHAAVKGVWCPVDK